MACLFRDTREHLHLGMSNVLSEFIESEVGVLLLKVRGSSISVQVHDVISDHLILGFVTDVSDDEDAVESGQD